LSQNSKLNTDISSNIFVQAREENIEAGTMTRGKVDGHATPISASGLCSDRAVSDAPAHSKRVAWPSLRIELPRLGRLLRLAARLLCREFYAALCRTKWSFQREPYWPDSKCQDCYLNRFDPRRLHLSGSGMLRCSADRQLVMSLHPWATDAELHLIHLAWYLGAEWASSNDGNLDGKKTYRVF
jgi:hypothetical protein